MLKNAVGFNVIFEELQKSGLEPSIIRKPSGDLTLKGVVADSRKVSKNHAFCAIKGTSFDGHEFILNEKTSLPLVIIERSDIALESIFAESVIRVNSTRAAWAQLESFFWGHPAKHLKLIGITGTNGKTSTVWMIGELMRGLSEHCATIGTLGIRYDGHYEETQHTTPDPDVLYPTLHRLVTKGIKYVAMEASSHALVQGKLWPLRFTSAGFTSFSQDHLDFHKDMAAYLDAKLILFDHLLDKPHHCLIHSTLLEFDKIRSLVSKSDSFKTYGSLPHSNYQVKASSNQLLGTTSIVIEDKSAAVLNKPTTLTLPMIGDVFADNFTLAAILTSQTLKMPLDRLAREINRCVIEPVPGRLERVKTPVKPWRPLVYIDYAHTPDALEKSLGNLKDRKTTLSVLFGCGGDRDRSKRPQMGAIAAIHAQKTFITSDNPRTEAPQSIIDEILSGITNASRDETSAAKSIEVIEDRRTAIFEAISQLRGRDCLLIAGKGHETYQIIGQQKFAFSDYDVASEALGVARSWLVIGAGLSGFAAAELASRFGDRVFLYDDKTINLPKQLLGQVTPCAANEIPWREINTVIASPGIPPEHALIKSSLDREIPVISEIDLGLQGYPGRTLAVTGTNGKSTTVHMTEFLGRYFGLEITACGNIGRPPSSLNLRNAAPDASIVIELSSYQLDGSYAWPSVAAAITSFSSDHLARHKTIENYFKAKWLISDWLEPGALFLISSQVASLAKSYKVDWPKARIVVVGPDASSQKLPVAFEAVDIVNGKCRLWGNDYDLTSFGIEGHHNQTNALFAAVMLNAIYNKPIRDSLEGLRSYKGLPFRCQVIFQSNDFRVINDSKSTNLESTLAALTMSPKASVLLMGGQGKGESYANLSNARDKIMRLIVFGASRREIALAASDFIEAEQHETMESAVASAFKLATRGKVDVLFSPGCASFDEFRNFEHRGQVFNELAKKFLRDH